MTFKNNAVPSIALEETTSNTCDNLEGHFMVVMLSGKPASKGYTLDDSIYRTKEQRYRNGEQTGESEGRQKKGVATKGQYEDHMMELLHLEMITGIYM